MLAWRSIERIALFGAILACAVFAINTFSERERSQSVATAQAQELAEILKVEAQENAHNVGEALPHGLVVKNITGHDVDLVSAIHRQTVLIKVAMDCSACIETLNWLRNNAGVYADTQHTDIVVLVIRSKVPPPGVFPPNVHLFYTQDDLSSGFLAGTLTPAEFLFDSAGKLVARRAGYDGNMIKKLSFPVAS